MARPTVYKTSLTSDEIFCIAVDDDLNGVIMTDGTHQKVGDHVSSLASLLRFLDAVLNTQLLPFQIQEGRSGRKVVKVNDAFARRAACLDAFADLYATDVSYSPDIDLYFACYRVHAVREYRAERPNLDIGNGTLVAETHNDFVLTLRAEAKKRGTRRKMADWKRNSDKNQRSMRRLIEGIFSRRSRVLVARMDFLYRRALVKPEDLSNVDQIVRLEAAGAYRRFYHGSELKHVPLNPARHDVRLAREDMDAFLKAMRGNPLFEHLEGYAWKLEYSRWGGFHYHCVFFFDGSRVMNDVYYAKRICELWETEATKGRGYGHNCNQDRRRYRGDGIGMVDHADVEKRAKLDRALSYIVKRDQHVRVKPSAKCRVFQTAGRTSKTRSNAGRPRGLRAMATPSS